MKSFNLEKQEEMPNDAEGLTIVFGSAIFIGLAVWFVSLVISFLA